MFKENLEMNNLPFLELQFKPSEAPSADVQKNSPPTLASCSEARLGLGLWTSLDLKGRSSGSRVPFFVASPCLPLSQVLYT